MELAGKPIHQQPSHSPTTRTHARALVQAVIFCNTKKKVDWLTEKMRESNFTVSAMHGERHTLGVAKGAASLCVSEAPKLGWGHQGAADACLSTVQ